MLICIDPGHGGYDSGAVGNGLQEKNINLIIARELATILTDHGIKVITTRPLDSDHSPGDITNTGQELLYRCRIANEAKADLYLSLHVNAGGGVGDEIYVSSTTLSRKGAVYDLALAIVTAGKDIAGRFHGEAVKDGSGLCVIANTNMPAMLFEIGFIDSADADIIKAHLHEYAAKIAPPLVKYLGGSDLPIKEVAAPKPAPSIQVSPYGPFIEWVVEKKIMSNYIDGSFKENEPFTRGMAAVVAKRLYELMKEGG